MNEIPLRRKERLLSIEQAIEVLKTSSFATLSLADGGNPYCIPVSHAVLNGYLYFHCAPAGHKITLIEKNPRACINAVSLAAPAPGFSLHYASANAFGALERVTDPAEQRAALTAISEKYVPEQMPDFDRYFSAARTRLLIFRLKLDRVTGKGRLPN